MVFIFDNKVSVVFSVIEYVIRLKFCIGNNLLVISNKFNKSKLLLLVVNENRVFWIRLMSVFCGCLDMCGLIYFGFFFYDI